MIRFLLFTLTLCIYINGFSQETYPVNGTHDDKEGKYAFTNATIFIDYKTKIENATLLIEKGLIKSVNKNGTVPKGYVKKDLNGKYIYPSFIDIYADYGTSAKQKSTNTNRAQQMLSDIPGAYSWNEALTPEYNAHKDFKKNNKTAEDYRNIGFGTVLSHRQDGIARGTGAMVTLADEKENEIFIKPIASSHLSFNKGTSSQGYPGSLMGSIALIKQTYYDAEWYAKAGEKAETNFSLQAWNDNLKDLPQVFEVQDWLDIFRANEIAKEFGQKYIYRSVGDEYQRINDIKAIGGSLIVPLNFPDAYNVADPYDAMNVSLTDLKHWEMAPANPAILEKHNIDFAITADGLPSKKDFWGNIRKAIQYGLSEEKALKALTYTPAKLIRAYDKIGSLERGKLANFIICTDSVFNKENVLVENWVQGIGYVINDEVGKLKDGKYHLAVQNLSTYHLIVSEKGGKYKFELEKEDSTKLKITHQLNGDLITLSFKHDKTDSASVRLSGIIESNIIKGRGQLPNGSWTDWIATFIKENEISVDTAKQDSITYGMLIYPFLPYGWNEKPEQETILFKNATVWTNEEEGILQNTDVLLQNGKIISIGNNLSDKDAKVIDATGKHLTSGIIDEHSHIAISRGVNECTQAVTAEVSIANVINSEDINIYRQLSGGVTAAQLLHGSCNPIGGQSALIKLRWGLLPEDMKIKDAPGRIKFALGENVKRSNFGDFATKRFPQTRMGVEQVYVDAFTRAREYQKAWENYKGLSKKLKNTTTPPRKDLELEIVLEVLNGKRLISCHSYVQSEINMLMKIAEDFGFTVNTFTHILEGYKVADKMKAHGAAGSTFADWWAYKYEVIDAIPYNGAIMHNAGVLTAFNSDDAEMGRRLNQEAAKAIKYGNVSEEEAWKFVTLNPAKMMKLDDKIGSIKIGKDADLVLWSDHPMSIYTKAESTYVDGICFYDRAKDEIMRKEIAKERNRLITKTVQAIEKGAKTQSVKPEKEKLYHCDDWEDEVCGTCE